MSYPCTRYYVSYLPIYPWYLCAGMDDLDDLEGEDEYEDDFEDLEDQEYEDEVEEEVKIFKLLSSNPDQILLILKTLI